MIKAIKWFFFYIWAHIRPAHKHGMIQISGQHHHSHHQHPKKHKA